MSNKKHKKRIMFAISTTRAGGAEVHCTRLVEYMANLQEYEVALLCFYKSDLWEAPKNVKTYYVGSRKEASLFKRFWRIRAAIKDFNPDLINAWNPEIMSLSVAFWGRLLGIKTITSRLVAHKSIFKGGLLREYLNLLADLLGDGIISNSPVDETDSYIFKKVFDSRKNIVIRNGIDPFIPQHTETAYLNLIDSDKNFKIIYAGRFTKVKRLDILLKAFFKLKAAGHGISLYLCGGQENDLLSYSKLLDENKKYKSDIHFLGFQKYWRDFGRHCNLFISPSENEGLSNSILEAMSLGLPIIVSNIRPNAQVCDDCKNALLFEVNNAESLAESIKRIMSDESLRETLSAGALEKSKEFSISEMSESYLRFFEEYMR